MRNALLLLLLLQVAGVRGQGALYTRWGRTSCSAPDHDLVYPGVAGGTYSQERGGASNYICITRDPTWGNYDDGQNAGGMLYGTEYQTTFFDPFQTNQDMNDLNVPCAVCKSTNSTTAIMIPGTVVCVSDWVKAYSGYLMSQSNDVNHYRSEYICVDSNPEYMVGGGTDQDGAQLYSVEGRCGSLPCPPYVDNRELTCVVCLQ